MKSKIISILAIFSAFFFSSVYAVETSTQMQEMKSKANQPSANEQANNSQANSKNGEVIAWLIVLNKNEIDASKEAANRKTDPAVKEYAKAINKDHSANLKETLKLSQATGDKPIQSTDSMMLKDQGQKNLKNLKPLDNKNFQVVFIDEMIKGHQDALQKLNQQINEVNNPELKKHLEATRNTVENHLQKAKEVQEKLKNKA